MFAIPTLAVGTYSSVSVQMFQNTHGFEGIGSTDGTVTLTAVTAESVAGTVAYDYTNAASESFTISGSFEVVRCAP